MSKTASGLVAYAKAQLGLPYWWGGYGQIANNSLLTQMKKLYPSVYFTDLYSDASSQFGKRVHDCVGLIKGYRWSVTPTSAPVYNSSQDVNVPGLYNQCSKRATISKMPDIPGVCVFMADMSHVGIYIGDGYVIEARGHKYGVVKTALKGRGWSLYGMPDWIDYKEPDPSPVHYTDYYTTLNESQKEIVDKFPELSMGSANTPYVGALQCLISFATGAYIGIDGIFGTLTESSLIRYQKDKNLEDDGIAGIQTWASFIK